MTKREIELVQKLKEGDVRVPAGNEDVSRQGGAFHRSAAPA